MDREKKLSKASAEKKPENVPLYLFRSGKNRRPGGRRFFIF